MFDAVARAAIAPRPKRKVQYVKVVMGAPLRCLKSEMLFYQIRIITGKVNADVSVQ